MRYWTKVRNKNLLQKLKVIRPQNIQFTVGVLSVVAILAFAGFYAFTQNRQATRDVSLLKTASDNVVPTSQDTQAASSQLDNQTLDPIAAGQVGSDAHNDKPAAPNSASTELINFSVSSMAISIKAGSTNPDCLQVKSKDSRKLSYSIVATDSPIKLKFTESANSTSRSVKIDCSVSRSSASGTYNVIIQAIEASKPGNSVTKTISISVEPKK